METGYKNQFKLFALLFLFCSTLIFAGCKGNDFGKSSQVLAKVGDKEITISYFERQLSSLPESVQKLSMEGKGKKALLEGLINREMLYREAEKRNLDKDSDLQRKLDDMKKELVINSFLQKEIINKIKVDDREIEDYYNSGIDDFRNREEIRISQIVVSSEKDAAEIAEQLKAKKDFGELAVKRSIDKVSAARNGDVGFFTKKELPSEVRESVLRMRVGEISRPHKMPSGYEIYKITDRKVVSYSLEQSKDAIKKQLMNQKFQESLKNLLSNLKKDVKVTINDNLLEKSQ